MKTGLDKRVQLKGRGETNTRFKNAKPYNYVRHPYLKTEFWLNPCNQFWNSDLYADEAKDYFNKSIGLS